MSTGRPRLAVAALCVAFVPPPCAAHRSQVAAASDGPRRLRYSTPSTHATADSDHASMKCGVGRKSTHGEDVGPTPYLYAPNMPSRSSLHVSLTPELSRFVESLVRSGRYQSANEVVREALRLLEARAREPVPSVDTLTAEIEVGLAQLRRGESVDGDTFFAELRERRAARG